MSSPSDEQIEILEARAYDEQYNEILRQYGKDAADKANYGWGVSGDDDGTDIATKVYGHGVLSSYISFATSTIDHQWRIDE